MKKLKDIDYKILSELIKNSKISDRKLAQKVGVSQPTVTRRRAMLEREKLLDYTAIPNLEKLNFEIMAFNFSSWKRWDAADKSPESEEYLKVAESFYTEHPNIIYNSTGLGMGTDTVSITIHKNYADYANYLKGIKEQWGKFLLTFESFMVSLKSDNVFRPLTFKHLMDYVRAVEPQPSKKK